MRRLVGVVTVVFWGSAAIMTVVVGLSWVAPKMRDEQSFLSLSGTLVALAMVFSAFLSWQKLRTVRRRATMYRWKRARS